MNKQKLEKKERNKKDREWRKQVLSNYNGKCFICGDIKLPNAHHIIPKNIEVTRWDVKNGIILCPKHHKFGIFSAHKNPLWFINLMMNNNKEKVEYLINKVNNYYYREYLLKNKN